MVLLLLTAGPARSHDPSASGGLFRSRDEGATWVSANRGLFLTGAIALAISPTEPDRQLLASENGLWETRNEGREWAIEAPSMVRGAVFALTFDGDGKRALASTDAGLFRGEPDGSWRETPAPDGATPARAIVRGREAGRVYLAGSSGLYRSDDWGASWSNAADGLPREPATALLAAQGTPDTVYVVAGGSVWASVDGARRWNPRGALPVRVDALAADLRQPARLWAAGGGRLFRSEDGGAGWRQLGRPLPEAGTTVNGLAASEAAIVATTDRGLYRSVDGGEGWTLITRDLPAHLEAGPLLRDPVDAASLYAGFALTPYTEFWRRAASRDQVPTRITLASVAKGAAFLLAFACLAAATMRGFARFDEPFRGVPSTRPVGRRHVGPEMAP